MRRPTTTTAAVAAVGLSVLATLAGCSIPDQSSPQVIGGVTATTRVKADPRPATPASARLTTWFVDSRGRLVPVSRSDPYGGLNVAIGELLAGPTSSEVGGGLTSAVPVGTKLIYSSISGSTASIDFSSELASVSGHEQLLAFAQIVETADAIPGVSAVEVSVAGQAVNAPQPDGSLAQGPVTASTYTSLLAHP